MFHPTSNTDQEPGQGASGYAASGEVWINNGAITFTATVITSHIDIATGKKIASDVVSKKTKVTSSDTYTTSAEQVKMFGYRISYTMRRKTRTISKPR